MAGVKGRSGRRRLPVAMHLERGTFRPDRHGSRPDVVGAVAVHRPATALTPPPKELTEGLSAAGAAFVNGAWAEFEGWTELKRLLLRRAGEIVDAQGALEGGPGGSRAREWLALHRALLSTLGALRLEDE